jgi:hypothetical protein
MGLVPATYALLVDATKDVGARDKPGHDELGFTRLGILLTPT